MDKLVLDIETSNTFADVGGEKNIGDLKVSLIGVYSYNQNKYFSFDENHIAEFEPLLKKTGLVIGFAINRFDIPVLNKHYNFDLFNLPRLDLLEEIELVRGHRVSLNSLAKSNLGLEKTHHSLEAITLYKDGNWEELKNYCLNDVKLTKDLYELAKNRGYLLLSDRDTGELVKTELNFKEIELPATLF